MAAKITNNQSFIGKALFYATLVVVGSGAYLQLDETTKIIPVLALALGAGFLAAWVERKSGKRRQCNSRATS